jgi:large subunit ribosomal protein L15
MEKKKISLSKIVKREKKEPVKKAVVKQAVKPAPVKKPKQELPFRALSLSDLHPPKGSHKPRKIKGRGPGSGHGKTSTRGSKGQTSRAGRDFYPGFEGGQTPLIRRIPKRGFTNKFKKEYQIVNIRDLDRIKEAIVTPEILKNSGLIKNKEGLVKILGVGAIQKSLTISAHAFSKKAAQAILDAGGSTQIIIDA